MSRLSKKLKRERTKNKKRSVKEGVIENRVMQYAKQHLGAMHRKLNGFGFNHWPDRLVLMPGCPELYIEFKKPGEPPTPMQREIHKELREQGREVWVEDNAELCISKLNAWFVANSRSR